LNHNNLTIEVYAKKSKKRGNYMQAMSIRFKNKSIPVVNYSNTSNTAHLTNKLIEMELDFEFRRKLKMISLIEIIGGVAIFKYHDGTKLYLEVS
jgi:K+ transporter